MKERNHICNLGSSFRHKRQLERKAVESLEEAGDFGMAEDGGRVGVKVKAWDIRYDRSEIMGRRERLEAKGNEHALTMGADRTPL